MPEDGDPREAATDAKLRHGVTRRVPPLAAARSPGPPCGVSNPG
jgi:hypothetical protein